jgi:hypothetical protein
MEHYYQNIPGGMFNYPLLYKHIVQQAVPNSRFVEVGCAYGKSSSYFGVEIINANKGSHLYCVDVWDKYDSSVFLKNIEPVKNVITSIKKDSVIASKDFDDDTLDFVYIDADHSYGGVTADCESWLPKLKNKSIMAGHDINRESVRRALVDTLLPFYSISVVYPCWIIHKHIPSTEKNRKKITELFLDNDRFTSVYKPEDILEINSEMLVKMTLLKPELVERIKLSLCNFY